MGKSFAVAAILASITTSILANPMSPSHMAKNVFAKRLTDGDDCQFGAQDAPVGTIFCIDSSGLDMLCEDCNNASSDQG